MRAECVIDDILGYMRVCGANTIQYNTIYSGFKLEIRVEQETLDQTLNRW